VSNSSLDNLVVLRVLIDLADVADELAVPFDRISLEMLFVVSIISIMHILRATLTRFVFCCT